MIVGATSLRRPRTRPSNPYFLMRKGMIVLAAALAGCSSQMKPGAIGEALDMRQYLPDTLRTAAFSPETTFRQVIVVGPDSARVELAWTTFRHGAGRYLANVSARLLAPVPYDSLALVPVSELENVGSKFEPSESAKIGVSWFKKTLLIHHAGETPFVFDAQGHRTIWPAVVESARRRS